MILDVFSSDESTWDVNYQDGLGNTGQSPALALSLLVALSWLSACDEWLEWLLCGFLRTPCWSTAVEEGTRRLATHSLAPSTANKGRTTLTLPTTRPLYSTALRVSLYSARLSSPVVADPCLHPTAPPHHHRALSNSSSSEKVRFLPLPSLLPALTGVHDDRNRR